MSINDRLIDCLDCMHVEDITRRLIVNFAHARVTKDHQGDGKETNACDLKIAKQTYKYCFQIIAEILPRGVSGGHFAKILGGTNFEYCILISFLFFFRLPKLGFQNFSWCMKNSLKSRLTI
jgi:hypothetical protein